MSKLVNALVCGVAFLSLFGLDHFLGHGFLNMSHRIVCKMFCSVRRTIIEEFKHVPNVSDMTSVVPVLLIEVLLLILTITFLNRYKQLHRKERIDALLDQSRDTLRQTNAFLDKWHNRHVPTKYSYLEDEPYEIKPLKVEIPILHMAIVDTIGTTRSKPERGDAGDTINITDSTLFSMTSLTDNEMESVIEQPSQDSLVEEKNDVKFKNRYLWNVIEEDSAGLDETHS